MAAAQSGSLPSTSLTQRSSSPGGNEELESLREDYREVSQQRDNIIFRCNLLEGEVQRCRELMKKLHLSTDKDDVDQRMDQVRDIHT